ncbi:MAG TPA: hypothetical protein VHS78_19915 [Candidatus Elarobacter sp.]|jgi:hypothetical protein|nr:hypothetical protein [Candidatus Elarobacter sp.]
MSVREERVPGQHAKALRRRGRRSGAGALLGAAAAVSFAFGAVPARADDAAPQAPPQPPPCAMPIAVALADRPGTGRTTSTGGSPCVVAPSEIVFETGVRRQTMRNPDGSVTLSSGPLTFVRAGVAKRVELGIAPPAYQSRAVSGVARVDAAHGQTDVVLAVKYLVLDAQNAQASLGASYAPPTGTGEFTAGAPTFSVSGNLGLALTPKLSLATSQVFGTAIGADVNGASRSFFVYAPSYTLAYALDGMTTVIGQAALVSRQGPVLPSGNRLLFALQRAVGSRLAVDLDYETNVKPTLGAPQHAVGGGLVWILKPAR